MSKALSLLAISLALLSGASTAQPARYFVPLVHAIISEDPVTRVTTLWVDNLSAFNAGQSTASLQLIAVYGGWSLIPGGRTFEIPASTGLPIDRWPAGGGNLWVASSTPGPLAVAEIIADPNVILNAAVERVASYYECPDTVTGGYPSQGRVSMPVFQGLFPANSTVVCGDVSLGEPDQTCGNPPETYLRRVNITLFNGGDEDADFSITAIPVKFISNPVFQETVTLAPKEVRQLNRIPIPVLTDLSMLSGQDVEVWITISGTQPFLAYVSSVFEGGAPDSIPMQVFPPRLVAAEAGH